MKENINEPIELVTDITKNGDKITIFLYKTNLDHYYYAVDNNGEDWSDISTKLPNNNLFNSIWVKEGGYEEMGADILVKNNILNKTSLKTKSGMNSYTKYDII